MIVGYARVSTDGQSLEAQHAALAVAGAERVFAEKQSGIKTDRAALACCMRSLEAGDVLLVTKARSARAQHQGLAEHPSGYRRGWC
jgi:DNA invertase Pin-like site-specific DNA recombinase